MFNNIFYCKGCDEAAVWSSLKWKIERFSSLKISLSMKSQTSSFNWSLRNIRLKSLRVTYLKRYLSLIQVSWGSYIGIPILLYFRLRFGSVLTKFLRLSTRDLRYFYIWLFRALFSLSLMKSLYFLVNSVCLCSSSSFWREIRRN